MRYLELPGHDPAFNLALEESLLLNLPRESDGLFLLWQNGPAIIIGRHQAAAEVVNQARVEAAKLPVIRRITGGGAVYHDLGNLNFSFIENVAAGKRIDFRRYLEPICLALADLGVKAEISGRNDLEVAGRKISGSGQIRLDGKILHHGTLLYNADLNAMHAFLAVSADKFRSRGIASQKARTANLLQLGQRQFALEDLKAALIRRCAQAPALLESDIMAEAEKLAAEKYRAWAWNYGKSPKFDLEKRRRFAWGEIAIQLQISGGTIRACKISGDFFSNEPIETLEARFTGLPFGQAPIANAFHNCRWASWFAGCNAGAMADFFLAGLFAR